MEEARVSVDVAGAKKLSLEGLKQCWQVSALLCVIAGFYFWMDARLGKVEHTQTKYSQEVTLMRKIVLGLTPAIKKLASSQEVDESVNASKTVQVIVPRANLRAGPSQSAEPILSVPDGTLLVEYERLGSWIKTMAPTGQEAWISSAVVEKRD